jgi:hypothetical protein
MLGVREEDRHARAGLDQLEEASRRLHTGTEEREPMSLGNNQARGEERDAAQERFPEQAVSLGVMLVAQAAERDPGAAIDEET